MKTVLIYRDELLHLSETFIAAQASAMRRYHPRYAALRRVAHSLPLPENILLLSQRRGAMATLRERVYRSTGFAPEFHRRLRDTHVSLIHAHFALDGAAALPIAERLGIPLVVTLHGYDATSSDTSLRATFAGRTYLARRKKLFERTSLFLCVSEFLRSRALAAGFPAEKLRVHRIGVDLERFQPRNIPRKRNLVLFIGRLVEKKGVEYLLRAMQLVPQAEIVVIGTGPLRQALESLAMQLGVRCRFAGVQTSMQIQQWLARATLLCAPSVTAANGDAEGLPIAICEAQAMGAPVVSTLHAGIPEAVIDGETGLLVPERDPEALAAAIARLLEDDALQSSMGRNAVERVRRDFALSKQTAELEEIYAALL